MIFKLSCHFDDIFSICVNFYVFFIIFVVFAIFCNFFSDFVALKNLLRLFSIVCDFRLFSAVLSLVSSICDVIGENAVKRQCLQEEEDKRKGIPRSNVFYVQLSLFIIDLAFRVLLILLNLK